MQQDNPLVAELASYMGTSLCPNYTISNSVPNYGFGGWVKSLGPCTQMGDSWLRFAPTLAFTVIQMEDLFLSVALPFQKNIIVNLEKNQATTKFWVRVGEGPVY